MAAIATSLRMSNVSCNGPEKRFLASCSVAAPQECRRRRRYAGCRRWRARSTHALLGTRRDTEEFVHVPAASNALADRQVPGSANERVIKMICDVNLKRGCVDLRRSDGRVNGRPHRKYIGRVRMPDHGPTCISAALTRKLSPSELSQLHKVLARCEAERDRAVPRSAIDEALAALLNLEGCAKTRPIPEEDIEVLEAVVQQIREFARSRVDCEAMRDTQLSLTARAAR